MKFQVMSTDEYGQTAILNTLPTIEAATKFMKEQVTDLNFSNALTTEDKFKSIEAYSVDIVDENGNSLDSYVYSGNTTDGRPRMLVKGNPGYSKEVVAGKAVRIFLGDNEGESHHLSTVKNVIVDSLDHELLEGKTEFFIRVV